MRQKPLKSPVCLYNWRMIVTFGKQVPLQSSG